MKEWIQAQVGRAIDELSGVVVLMDPDGLLSDIDLEELADEVDVACVANWLELRRTWDLDVRRRELAQLGAVLIVNDDFRTATDLPWDIEHEAAAVIRVRCPVPDELRPLFCSSGELADRLAAAAKRHRSAVEIVRAAFKIRTGNAADELETIARLRLDPSTPEALWDQLAGMFETELARDIVARRGALDSLQNAWNDWLVAGSQSRFAEALSPAPGALIPMFASGLLTRAPAQTTDLPNWVSLGTSDPDPDAVIAELLGMAPASPSSVPEWIEAASWWGQTRWAIASQASPPASAELAWEAWRRLDEQFLEWLRRSYGTSLLSASSTPRAVHQIAPYLARRVDDGAKIVLIVIDGLGFAQWHQLRNAAALRTVQATGCLAMIPTLTTVSRQAIFAGALPIDFADTITTTAAEPRRWQSFWSEHGIPAREVAYTRTLGSDPSDVPELAGRTIAVVVNAVDELLHAAEVLGDRQVASGVDLWARAGFLQTLVENATAGGYEIWVTSDHGNLPAVPGHVLREGLAVSDAAGTRVRLYANEVLRAQSAAFGIAWDPPGYPRGTRSPLFAPGRSGFFGSGTRVSHGGLSIDEVIVPFAQVTR